MTVHMNRGAKPPNLSIEAGASGDTAEIKPRVPIYAPYSGGSFLALRAEDKICSREKMANGYDRCIIGSSDVLLV